MAGNEHTAGVSIGLDASYVRDDALGTAYREGQRSIGIQLTAMLTITMK